MDIDLEPVTAATTAVFCTLAQLYQYDFSEIEGGIVGPDGRFGYLDDLPERLSVPGAAGWLFRTCDPEWNTPTIAGFALVLPFTTDPATRAIDEFFVLRRFRARGVGRAAATAILRATPGAWIVQGTRHNIGAREFWRRVLRSVAIGDVDERETPHQIYPAWTFRVRVAGDAGV